jgi:hypothetical protein
LAQDLPPLVDAEINYCIFPIALSLKFRRLTFLSRCCCRTNSAIRIFSLSGKNRDGGGGGKSNSSGSFCSLMMAGCGTGNGLVTIVVGGGGGALVVVIVGRFVLRMVVGTGALVVVVGGRVGFGVTCSASFGPCKSLGKISWNSWG